MSDLKWSSDVRLSQLDIARVAAGILFSVAASVWLINEGDVRLSLMRWLLIVITTGLIINSQEGLCLKSLAVASGLCSIVAYTGVYFQSFLICRQEKVLVPPFLSGVNLCVESSAFIAGFMSFLIIFSGIAIFLAGICRPLTVAAISGLPKYAKRAQTIEKNLRAIFISVGAIFVMLKIVSIA